MNTRQENEDQFDWWITCIPDKIIALKKNLPEEISIRLDCSIQSLDVLEKFLLDNFSIDDLQRDKELWDRCASYVARTYKKNIANSEWYIELDDDKNVFYNKPSLRVVDKFNFVPHSYVTAALDRKQGNFISTIINKHLNSGDGSKKIDG